MTGFYQYHFNNSHNSYMAVIIAFHLNNKKNNTDMRILFIAVPIIIAIWLLTSQFQTSESISKQADSPTEFNSNAAVLSAEVQAPQKNISPIIKDKESTSLKGTDKDGAYPVDSEGNLLISAAIKERFEYFLSTLGEFPFESILQMVRDDIALSLQSPAKEQALKLFDDYIAYKYALAELEKSMDAAQDYEVNDIERFRLQLDRLRDKRREYLSQDTVDAFFGFDEMYDDFMLARLEIQNSSQLSKQEKQEQIESLEGSLPEAVKDMRDDSQKISNAFKVSEAMREDDADEGEIFEYNSQQFGQEAAVKLQALNEQRSAWKVRVENYLQKKSDIEMNANLTADEKNESIEMLKSQGFNDSEIKRLPAFEIIYGQH